ncbi:MAG: hypothetical protein QME66_01000 [Candidatus Eisenbacteria bacterium]|nr:hypothetical protein [Candidatus Eisenbacteria bacterium]
MVLRKLLLLFFALVCVVIAYPAPVPADDVTDQIDGAVKLYKEGKFSQAASELDFALQQIREKQAEKLKGVFPKPLAGWTAEEPEMSAAGASFMGGGISASVKYQKPPAATAKPSEEGAEEVEIPEVGIEMMTDSPLLQGMLPLLTNPALMGSQGGKLVKVKTYRGVSKKAGDGGGPELTLVVANKVLLTLKGSNGATEADLLAYANAIDFVMLEKLVAP